jgi:cysteine desulfurase
MRVYLDHNATTPPHPLVLAKMAEVAEVAWANPSSVHHFGQRARAELDACRAAVARLVGMSARDVVLTSGGTEANNLALRHAFAKHAGPSGDGEPARRLVVSALEHPSVTGPARALEREGVAVDWLLCHPSGRIDPSDVARALQSGPALVSVAAVNHETGVVQPIEAIAACARDAGAQLHVDAVQAVGRLEPSSWAGADLVTVAAHKIRGPKGIGALVTRPGLKLHPLLVGGEQERGLRPGTQSAALAAGFAVAAAHGLTGPERYRALEPLRDRLEVELIALGRRFDIDVVVNGEGRRAPHISNCSWPGWRSAELCAALDLEGVAVSSGSACSAGTAEPSTVIAAMLGTARAAAAVRISLGETSRSDDLEAATRAWTCVLERAARKTRKR